MAGRALNRPPHRPGRRPVHLPPSGVSSGGPRPRGFTGPGMRQLYDTSLPMRGEGGEPCWNRPITGLVAGLGRRRRAARLQPGRGRRGRPRRRGGCQGRCCSSRSGGSAGGEARARFPGSRRLRRRREPSINLWVVQAPAAAGAGSPLSLTYWETLPVCLVSVRRPGRRKPTQGSTTRRSNRPARSSPLGKAVKTLPGTRAVPPLDGCHSDNARPPRPPSAAPPSRGPRRPAA